MNSTVPYYGAQRELANRFNCTPKTVRAALNGESNSARAIKIRAAAEEMRETNNINPKNNNDMTKRNSVKVRPDGSLLLTTTDGQNHEFYGFSALVNYLKEQNIDVNVNDITEE